MAGHIENFYYLMAKVRAHYLRLPKELQKRIELGLVKSFDQVSTLNPEVPTRSVFNQVHWQLVCSGS